MQSVSNGLGSGVQVNLEDTQYWNIGKCVMFGISFYGFLYVTPGSEKVVAVVRRCDGSVYSSTLSGISSTE
jgi:hypothetical protein